MFILHSACAWLGLSRVYCILLTGLGLVPVVTGLRGLVTVVNDEDVRLGLLRHARAVIIGAGYLQAGGRPLLLLLSLGRGEASDLVIISLSWLQREKICE